LKLLLTAFHHPSILVTRFFFRLNAELCESPAIDDLAEPPDDWRGRSSTPERFWLGDIL
jgi:hypothetical protein